MSTSANIKSVSQLQFSFDFEGGSGGKGKVLFFHEQVGNSHRLNFNLTREQAQHQQVPMQEGRNGT